MSCITNEVSADIAGLRIWVFSDLFPPHVRGGAELSTNSLVQSLVALGARVCVFTSSPEGAAVLQSGDGFSIARSTPLAVSVSPYAGTRRAIDKVLWQGSRFLDSLYEDVTSISPFDPDVVITSNVSFFGSSIWAKIRKKNIPIIHIVRDFYSICSRGTRSIAGVACKKTCFGCGVTKSIRGAGVANLSGVVFISKFLLNVHRREIGGNLPKFQTVIPVSVASSIEPKGANGRKSEGRVFGLVARLTPEKGVLPTIRAFRHGASPKDTLFIGGEFEGSDFKRQVLSEVEGDGRIELLGRVDPRSFYAKLDVHVAPSLWDEPLSRTPIEAAMAGVPSVVSNRGGQPEIIEALGLGAVCDPNDVVELSEAMFGLRTLVGDNVKLRAEAERHYGEEGVASKYAKLLNLVLGRSSQREL